MSQEQTQDQSQDNAIHVLVIGNDAKENAVVIEALQHYGTPLQVAVSNLMPRNISLPELTTEVLQHVASGAELSSCTGTIRDHASLVRLAGNVQSVCQLNDYRNGISIKPVNVKSDADTAAQAAAAAAAAAAAEAEKAAAEAAAKSTKTSKK